MSQSIGFKLNNVEMCVPIEMVQEIIRPPKITAIPNVAQYIEGVANLRGRIISVINLKTLLGMRNDDANGGRSAGKRVIVLTVNKASAGILVDDISGVLNYDESNIESMNLLPSGSDKKFASCIVRLDERIIIALNAKKILQSDEACSGLLEDSVIDVRNYDDGSMEISKIVAGIGGEYVIKERVSAQEYLAKKQNDSGLHPINQSVMDFLDAIAREDYEAADSALHALQTGAHGTLHVDLFQQVGRVTRKLHDSVQAFKEALDPKLKDMAVADMPSAIDQLEAVILKTEEAANKTMNIVEDACMTLDSSVSIIETIEHELEGKCSAELAELKMMLDSMRDGMNNILMTQSFQDLTGQTIKKVIRLVGDIEAELVTLISTFGVKTDAENAKKLVMTGGPSASERVGQSDVDNLLSELGF